MALSRVDHTDATAATDIDAASGFSVNRVLLDDEHTLASWKDDGGQDFPHLAVLHHPEAGGGSWGSIVALNTTETLFALTRVDATTALGITFESDLLYARFFTISGTTITVGAQQEITGDDISGWFSRDSGILTVLSTSRALLVIRGRHGGPVGLILNLSGTTLGTVVEVQLHAEASLLTGDNSDFEGGIGDWQSNNVGIVLAQSTEQAFEGSNSLKVDHNVSVNPSDVFMADGEFPVTAGRWYEAIARIFKTGGGGDLDLLMEWYDSGGALLSTSGLITNKVISRATDRWEAWRAGTIAPASAASARIRLRADANISVVYYVDLVEAWDFTDDPYYPLAARALDGSRVLLIYKTLGSAGSTTQHQLGAVVLTVTSADVTMGAVTLLESGVDGPLADDRFHEINDSIFELPNGSFLVPVNVDDSVGGSAPEWHNFVVAVSGTTVSATQDPTELTSEAQGDWTVLLDWRFIVHFRTGTPVTTSRPMYRIYEIDQSTGFITGPELAATLDTGMVNWGGGGQTFAGQRRLVVIGPLSSTANTLHGKEFEIVGLPTSVFYVGPLPVA